MGRLETGVLDELSLVVCEHVLPMRGDQLDVCDVSVNRNDCMTTHAGIQPEGDVGSVRRGYRFRMNLGEMEKKEMFGAYAIKRVCAIKQFPP